ncbi:arsenite efflux transporter metallochaperone ArsD [Saccharopolyspora sp. HNM0986]|uniref:arsenite efflux transporter metallochaperone ArsD n=1 Tax=Saccharopolyspora galaxeae TaxID=2781241 RepID=UPI00190A42E0|nr:arsenite efflux transporter metallochaperone ArsD [Saccharopolyspora sp. HNM0986]MBK0868751.1 arsenite efflux transporter metallochaperone ArsD [Saccharopolyspora sp. HNM0986]
MTSVEIYDPAMCCSTGVCGPSVDPALTQFAADVEWLGSAGVEVHRFGLSTEPGKFVENAEVGALLKDKSEEALPAVFVDGALRTSGRYPTRVELAEWTGVSTERPGLPVVEQSESGGCCGGGEC